MAMIRHFVRAKRYFEVVGRTLDLIQREMENPARGRRAENLLARLRDDMSFIQHNYSIVERKESRP